MAVTTKVTRVVGNPGRKKPRSRSNPGQIVGWTLGNPGRKAGNMAKTKKKHHAGSRANKGYKRNPAHHTTHHTKHHHKTKHYRRNPGASSIGHLVTNAVFVIAGALGSKLGAQMVLGSNNVGLIGYAGNAASGAVLWFLAEKVLKNRTAAEGILAGTAVQIVLRLINDYTPFGQYVSNLGMGDYQMQSFVTPQVLVSPLRNAQISIPPGWAPQIAAPAPAQTMPAAVGVASKPTGGSGVGNMYGQFNLGAPSMY